MKKILLILCIGITFFSCKKEEENIVPPLHSVTMTMYSQRVPYTFAYSDSDGDRSETVTTQNYSKTFNVSDYEYENQMGVIKIGTVFPDSLYVRANVDGKMVEQGVFINCPCSADALIQLQNAQ